MEQASEAKAAIVLPRQSALRTALAGLIGNVLEWFDFAVYGCFASDIGKQFFPQSDHIAQQLYGLIGLALMLPMKETSQRPLDE
ncbi:MAG: hypothetical protein LAP85_06690 [Acidobacteriia bacterium]|nr:hypothetical protein [Terriglobia bacterium]